MPAEWNVFQAGLDTSVEGMPGVYVGGDCATGPSTAIRAIAAGKVAAHNIDEYLGYHHNSTVMQKLRNRKRTIVFRPVAQTLLRDRLTSENMTLSM